MIGFSRTCMLLIVFVAATCVPTMASAFGSERVAHFARACAPPEGPGDNAVHSGDVHAHGVSCGDARRLMIVCDRYSYGHAGDCAAVGRRWYCTSRSTGGTGSTEKCTSGRRIVRWIWLD